MVQRYPGAGPLAARSLLPSTFRLAPYAAAGPGSPLKNHPVRVGGCVMRVEPTASVGGEVMVIGMERARPALAAESIFFITRNGRGLRRARGPSRAARACYRRGQFAAVAEVAQTDLPRGSSSRRTRTPFPGGTSVRRVCCCHERVPAARRRDTSQHHSSPLSRKVKQYVAHHHKVCRPQVFESEVESAKGDSVGRGAVRPFAWCAKRGL